VTQRTATLEVLIPDWASHIAQNSNGSWWAYEEAPTIAMNAGEVGEWGIPDDKRTEFLCKSMPNPEFWHVNCIEVPR
jgi:hypothetical protein